ncbi:MAG: hypothetical protein IMZ55_06415 [Acidobacteria bacterium]|nr:hypothetical protein [Acidobacteriota bacterium]
MAGPFGTRNVQPGDAAPRGADALNAMLEVARAHRLGQLAGSQGPPEAVPSPGLIFVQLPASSGNLPALSVLALREPIFAPDNEARQITFSTTVGFNVAVPAAADVGTGKFVISWAPIRDAELGQAWPAGVVPCHITVTDANHGFADVTADTTAFLTSGASGPAQILWKEAGTGLKWAVVRLGTKTSEPFTVKVEKDGGVAGDDATECSYTYTVKDLSGNTLDTTVTPETPRLHYTAYWYAGETRTLPNVATSVYGLACWDGATLVLLQCFGEVAKDDACPA